jgi:anti-sigma B factor antagonist
MTLSIDCMHKAKFVEVRLAGRLTVGDASNQLHTKVREMLAAGDEHLILDMAEVSYVDSVGLGELVAAAVAARNVGADVQLANVPKRLRELLEISHLFSVLTILSTQGGDQVA